MLHEAKSHNEKINELQKLVDEAESIVKLFDENLTPQGFKTLWTQYEAIELAAIADLEDESKPDETLKMRQRIRNLIKKWLDVPNEIIRKGNEAKAEMKRLEDEKIKERPDKSELIK